MIAQVQVASMGNDLMSRGLNCNRNLCGSKRDRKEGKETHHDVGNNILIYWGSLRKGQWKSKASDLRIKY